MNIRKNARSLMLGAAAVTGGTIELHALKRNSANVSKELNRG